ncbi:MAG: TVP38/TMEM64 family protein [Phycisphaerae bacterium]|nr:TVP38/TMEM64 family protein [Phycisphaerae bacterium]
MDAPPSDTDPSTSPAAASKPPWSFKQIGPTAILGVLWAALPALLGTTLLIYLGPVSEWLKSLGPWGWIMYAAVFVFSAGIGFLPTYGQSFLGGWTFGMIGGFPGAMIGFVGGSVLGYFISRSVSRHKVEDALAANPKSRAVREALIGHGFWRTLGIVTLIRIPPNSPFALTNLVMASAGVKLGPYLIGTAVGMAPRTALAVWIAHAGASTGAADIQTLIENHPWWFVPAGILLVVVVLAIIGMIANRALAAVTASMPSPAAAPPPLVAHPSPPAPR